VPAEKAEGTAPDFGLLTGAVSIPAFFDPDNIARILDDGAKRAAAGTGEAGRAEEVVARVDVRPSAEGYHDLAHALDLRASLLLAEAMLLGQSRAGTAGARTSDPTSPRSIRRSRSTSSPPCRMAPFRSPRCQCHRSRKICATGRPQEWTPRPRGGCWNRALIFSVQLSAS
jgi:hypothetical protein